METTIMEGGYCLPSKGLIYSKQVEPLVELRSMTTREEMKRLSPSNTPYKVLADIIESCMLEKPAIKVYDMCLADYEYLLHKLRVVSYGPRYTVIAGCPHCGNTFEKTIDLDELEVKEYNQEEVADLMSFTLPKSGDKITIRYKTPRMLDEIELAKKEFKKKNPAVDWDPSIMIELRYLIETVNGDVLNYAQLDSYIQKLLALDMRYILDKSLKLEQSFGLNTLVTLNCSQCGGEVITFFRNGQDFFRPEFD